jgi:hypothetical protein
MEKSMTRGICFVEFPFQRFVDGFEPGSAADLDQVRTPNGCG